MRAFRRLNTFLRPYRTWAILAPLCMVLEVAMDVLQPRLIQSIIDQGIGRHDQAHVVHTGLAMLGVALVGILGGVLCTVFAVWVSEGYAADLRRALFAKVQTLSFANLDTLETGALITRLTNDVTQVQNLVMAMLRFMVRVPLLLVGSLTMAVITGPKLATLFLPLTPLVAVTLALIIRKSYPLYGLVQARLDALNTVLQENLAGVRVVKAFARADHEGRRFGRANEDLVMTNITVARIGAATMPLMMLFLNLGVVSVLWLGGYWSVHHGLEVGRIVAFVNYMVQTLMSLMIVSMLIMMLSRSEASAKRLNEVPDSVPRVTPPEAPEAPEALRGRLAFENVSFAYDGEENRPALSDLSFVVEPGETVAVLGATGSGKSSLVGLAPRFYDVTAGRVTLDGVDVRRIDPDLLRRAVVVALQETVLFSGSVRDNIRYGRPDATDEEVEVAARAAEADGFIRGMAEGYDTVVGQRGVNLSGGQKQRIAIARALLVRPALLIMDDSTSAVDVRTEARIRQNLVATAGGQSRLIVAQRVSSAMGADRVIVLDEGRLVAQGSHTELLRTSPIYREIYESQMEPGVHADASA